MPQRYAVIENGRVVNVILADEGFIAAHGLRAVPSDEAGPGWAFDGTRFTPPPRPPDPPAPPDPRREALAEARALIAAVPDGRVKAALDVLRRAIEGA